MSESLSDQMMRAMDDWQKTVFLKTLLFASKVDGQVDDSEIKYIKKMASKYKVNDIKKIFDCLSIRTYRIFTSINKENRKL